MIVLLEGPDGVGKTSLSQALERSHAGPVLRMSSGPPSEYVHPYIVYYNNLEHIADHESRGEMVIIDRLHVGELVYGHILRDTDFTIDQACVIDMMLMGMGAALVHCWLPVSDAISRLLARDGGAPDKKSGSAGKHARAIHASFSGLCGTPTRDSILPGNWQKLVMDEYPDALAHRVLAAALAAEKFVAMPNFIGHFPTSEFVFAHHDPDLPLLEFLVSFARERGILKKIGIFATNPTMRVISAPYGKEVEVDLSNKTVIALSTEAKKYITELGVDSKLVVTRDDEYCYDSPPWINEMEASLGIPGRS